MLVLYPSARDGCLVSSCHVLVPLVKRYLVNHDPCCLDYSVVLSLGLDELPMRFQAACGFVCWKEALQDEPGWIQHKLTEAFGKRE